MDWWKGRQDYILQHFDIHDVLTTDISVITQKIQSKLNTSEILYPDYIMKVSSEIRFDAQFLNIIDRKFHFRYIGVNDTVASRLLRKTFFLNTWRRDAIKSLIFFKYLTSSRYHLTWYLFRISSLNEPQVRVNVGRGESRRKSFQKL